MACDPESIGLAEDGRTEAERVLGSCLDDAEEVLVRAYIRGR
ncbi:hypothetical protein ACFQVD_04180 [Streptosporangium amethystogenes subsp. fukuiense]|uniref:Uncharacterized protein n=1 Tax=Streptosporangium amethystogenes subsp. fukuiense TaxID=698418 RepID=A0ABW2SSL5_9ACTN